MLAFAEAWRVKRVKRALFDTRLESRICGGSEYVGGLSVLMVVHEWLIHFLLCNSAQHQGLVGLVIVVFSSFHVSFYVWLPVVMEAGA